MALRNTIPSGGGAAAAAVNTTATVAILVRRVEGSTDPTRKNMVLTGTGVLMFSNRLVITAKHIKHESEFFTLGLVHSQEQGLMAEIESYVDHPGLDLKIF